MFYLYKFSDYILFNACSVVEEMKSCDHHSLDFFLPENLIKQICGIFCCYLYTPSICFPGFQYTGVAKPFFCLLFLIVLGYFQKTENV